MRSSCILVIVALVLFSNCECAFSQSDTFPINPPVGIGTQLSTPSGPLSALQIHFDPTYPTQTKEPIMRLSEGTGTTTTDFGILGLMVHSDTTYSSLSRGDDLILHQQQDGDIIITNFSTIPTAFAHGTAIRFATTGDTTLRSNPSPGHRDLDRLTINGNGNIGIDLPPNATTGLDSALDQVQIGGGVVPPVGFAVAMPGLTMYGGNRFEGLPKIGGGFFPFDWRYIAFNQYTDHSDSSVNRSKRIALMSSSEISFAANDNTNDGGMIDLHCSPYTIATGLNDDTSHGLNLHLTGNQGFALWCDVSQADIYHHLFDADRPGYLPSGITRNPNGMFYHHTPVYICSDSGSTPLCDFQNLAIKPDIGDSTWMLVVNGPALVKEIFVDDSDWPDYVFNFGYKLPSLGEVENYIEANHHLPDIEPASKIAKTGVPVGRTEAAITKQMEEMMLYTIELKKEVEALKSEIQELKNEKGK